MSQDKVFKMPELDSTLTQEEKDAPTFLEWSDATLARAVRCLSKRIHDDFGQKSITGVAGAIQLANVLVKAGKIPHQVDLGTNKITVNFS